MTVVLRLLGFLLILLRGWLIAQGLSKAIDHAWPAAGVPALSYRRAGPPEHGPEGRAQWRGEPERLVSTRDGGCAARRRRRRS